MKIRGSVSDAPWNFMVNDKLPCSEPRDASLRRILSFRNGLGFCVAMTLFCSPSATGAEAIVDHCAFFNHPEQIIRLLTLDHRTANIRD